jgi:hypothetical protein
MLLLRASAGGRSRMPSTLTPLGVKGEGAVPGRGGLTALVVGLDPRDGHHQLGLAHAAQNGGQYDVG